MRLIRNNLIDIIMLYWKSIYYHAFFLLRMRPILRLNAICQKHRFHTIGKTKIIGDRDFISYCEEFSQCLRKIDPPMYDDLFIKNKFVFIQYSDAKVMNVMFGEYAVPAHYQKFKANGIGAVMIYGFYCTQLSGRTLGSYVRHIRQPPGFSRIPIEKTYNWLTEHQFPDTISKWYKQNLEATKAGRGCC